MATHHIRDDDLELYALDRRRRAGRGPSTGVRGVPGAVRGMERVSPGGAGGAVGESIETVALLIAARCMFGIAPMLEVQSFHWRA